MLQRRDVLESAVGEWGSVVALGRSEPADLPVEPVIVVIAGEVGERGLGVGQRAEDLPIENLALERGPEGLDLPVRPGRVHLGLDVAHRQLAKGLAKAVEHPGHPVHELGAVVAHEVERTPTELDAVAQPDQDRRDLTGGGDAQTEDVPGVIVNQTEDPGLEVALTRELDEERSLDVDMPKRIGNRALIASTALPRERRPPARARTIPSWFAELARHGGRPPRVARKRKPGPSW